MSNNLNMKDSLKLTTQAIKRYVDNQIAENGFSGDYNDLLNQPINSLPVHSYSSNNRIIFIEVMNLEKHKWYKLDSKDAIESNSSLSLAHFFEDGTSKNFSALTGGYAYSLFFVQAKGTNTITLRQLDSAGGFSERVITIGADSDSTTSTLVPLSLNTLNEKEFIPTKDYHPATKKYIDNAIEENGFSGDYNDLNNRPCYDNSESIECTYDGNATGRVIATDPFEAMVKVSDKVIDYETYLKSVVGIHYPDGIQYHKISDKIEGEDYFLTKSKKMIWGGNVTVVYEDNVELWGAVFPERGIYFHDASLLIGYNDPSYVCSFSAVIKEGEIKQLDEKFIPDTIATKKYVDDTTPQLDTRAYTGKTVTISYSGDQNDYDTKITINENGWGYPFVFVRMKDSISYDEFYSGVSYDMKWSDGFIETFECNGCDKINDDCEFINSFIYNIREAINSTELSNFVGYDFESVNIPEGLWFADYSASQGGDILEVPLSFTYEEIEGELRPVNKDDRLATKEYVDNAIANASLGNGSDVSDSGVIEDSEFDNLISGTFGPEYVDRDE